MIDGPHGIIFPVWQEAFQNGQGQLSKNAIVHVWKGEDWQNVTHKVILINDLKPLNLTTMNLRVFWGLSEPPTYE